MIHLYKRRQSIVVPTNWAKRVTKAFKNHALFLTRAQDFERKPLQERKTLGGFACFAPDALALPSKTRRGRVPARRSRKKKAEFPCVWKYASKAINDLSYGNCAYCQSPVEGVSYGEVEHFKPKSLFPTLAYDWGNYLLSCGPCNRKKRQNWPPGGEYVRPDVARDPEARFVFHPDGTIKAARGDAEAKRTIEDFGLNRPGLKRRRRMTIRAVERALGYIIGGAMSMAKQRSAARNFLVAIEEPYSAAVRACVRVVWEKVHGRHAL